MTDAGISHKLALAIGYQADAINATPDFCNVWHKTGPKHVNCAAWRRWAAVLGGKVYETATPEMAVALAVIGGAA